MHSQESGPTSQGGSKPDPPSFFPWRLQWGLSIFQWGSNPHNPPANFYPALVNKCAYVTKICLMYCCYSLRYRYCNSFILISC